MSTLLAVKNACHCVMQEVEEKTALKSEASSQQSSSSADNKSAGATQQKPAAEAQPLHAGYALTPGIADGYFVESLETAHLTLVV